MVYNSCKQSIIHFGYIPVPLTVRVEINNLRNTCPPMKKWVHPQIRADVESIHYWHSAAKAHCGANLRLQLRAHAFTEFLPGDIQGLLVCCRGCSTGGTQGVQISRIWRFQWRRDNTLITYTYWVNCIISIELIIPFQDVSGQVLHVN